MDEREIQIRPGLPGILEVFTKTLDSQGTRRSYQDDIREFFQLSEKDDPREITILDIGNYREAMMSQWKPGTVAKKMVAIRRFMEFCRLHGLTKLSRDVVDYYAKSPRQPGESPVKVLAPWEIRDIVKAARSLRDRAILAFFLRTGVRVSELCGVNLEDFEQVKKNIIFVEIRGKGNKTRRIPIDGNMWELIKKYVKSSGRSFTKKGELEGALFLSETPGRFSPRGIHFLVTRLAKRAGIEKRVHPHSFRHTCGTQLAEHGCPLILIQQLLGHSSPSTTMRYVRVAESLKAKVLEYTAKIEVTV